MSGARAVGARVVGGELLEPVPYPFPLQIHQYDAALKIHVKPDSLDLEPSEPAPQHDTDLAPALLLYCGSLRLLAAPTLALGVSARSEPY
jgi:hypothetical protein